MSFRALWIISKESNNHEDRVLFSRKYPTVERRHQLIHDTTQHGALLDDQQLAKCLFSKMGISRKTDAFIEEHDGCQFPREPVLEVDCNEQKLWPIIAVEKSNVVLACLALVEGKGFDSTTPLVEIPTIAIGYALLHNISEFLEIPPGSNIQLSSLIDEVLNNLLKIMMPFGTPTDTNLNTMKSFMAGKDIGWVPKYKLSAWRPISHKGRNQVHFSVQEKISAAIYNRPEKNVYKDMCHVHGTVSCKAELEGVPEVSINLKSKVPVAVVFHPCLQSHDLVASTTSGTRGSGQPEFYNTVEQTPISRNIRFTPPLEHFPLCHFNGDSQLPVSGVYQLVHETEVTRLQLELQLGDGIKNSFELFEVRIPFFHSGPITKLDFANTWGTVLVSPEKRRLVWSIGQKFPRSGQASLNATVLLGDPSTADRNHFKEDPFCHGLNTYIQLFFKMPNVSMNNIVIDPKSVQVNPSARPKVNVGHELVSSDYKIWNVFGDAVVAFPPTL